MAETKTALPTVLGTLYPRHFVVAAIHDPGQAEAAVAALRESGFADADVRLCPGSVFVQNYRAYEAHRGLLERAAALFPSEEAAVVEEYLAEAERDVTFVAVHAPERDRRERARAILAEHGGHAMRYYGDATITDL